jgi:hypothetical protein
MRAVTPGLDFMIQPKEYILLNSTDMEIILQHHGETRRIPPRNKVIKKHKKYSDVPCSMKDAKGRYIPGTLVIGDIVADAPMGGKEIVWQAAEAIKERLGIDTNTGTYTSAMALRGLSVVPPDADMELIKKIDADGVARWKQFRIREAAATIATYDDRNEKRRALGGSALPPDEKYLRAEAALKHLRSEEAARLIEEFSKISQVELAPEEENEMFEDPDPLPESEALREVADELAPPVVDAPTPEEIPQPPNIHEMSALDKIKALEDDPKAMKAFKVKYNIRKRSYARKGARKDKEAANA